MTTKVVRCEATDCTQNTAGLCLAFIIAINDRLECQTYEEAPEEEEEPSFLAEIH